MARQNKTDLKNWIAEHKFYVGIGVFVLVVATLNANSKSSITNNSTPTSQEQTQSISNTPTLPKDPCRQYMGTQMYVDCENVGDAMNKGQLLKYPLKAKVTFDSTALYITNEDTQKWEGCGATVNEQNPEGDNFTSDGFDINPGQTESIGWGNFANAEQARFNYFQKKPQTIDLECAVGNQNHRSLFTL
ncbi:MAG TPA: hypothetical protein VNW29_06920 [Candidatus Sulfotelmatobacter sp.]|jgi:hypothetical protein|nr:hypothetical protein [Candidatus Sulfotelmatobacter sp.]